MGLRHIRGGKRQAPPFFLGPILIIQEIWRNRNLTKHLVKKDIKLAYHGTFLGYFWTMLEPLLMTVILYTLFVIMRGSTDEFLPLKVMLGILFYACFSKTTSMCNNVLLQQSSLINQVYFPREIFHINVVAYQLYRLVMSLIIIIPMMAWYNLSPSVYLFWLLPSALGVGMLGLGFGMITSILQVKIRDVSQLVQVLLRGAFFISGVFYGAEHVPSQWLDVHLLNPVAVFIELSRTAVLGDMGVLDLTNIVYALGVSFIVMVIGMCIFKKFEARMVKYL
ncbi:MAG: hypothetical protein CMF94_01120 [Candidatus Marinimicrobia bacterium]|nr:hypothetical protein [Candidatus Neomarinimicrobiota bacterium]